MIAFQCIKTGQFVARMPIGRDYEFAPLLAGAMPYAAEDEDWLRRTYLSLDKFRTVTYSSRIDHPANDLSKLSREELAARYPIAR